ncbi:PREDICTED: uncharacterized protein LOC105568670 [Vollenhovia emeryi]|uniref:uncharacterized protein LOC105568670 n=1 Tax=Vollenhovia emeryi TaxID=411798 RepID=UPI0005F57F59|nr:PREDICTED: uncharacterized protein LOC105568670 [Vollenhovia emeryi]
MERLRYLHITNALIGLLFHAGIAKATGQDVITSLSSNALDNGAHNKFIMRISGDVHNGCECFKYDCGCCQYLDWDAICMNGKLCANATYLRNDFGFSLTVTFNNFAIINETISARNPPPICFGEDIIDALEVDICLRIYDIDIKKDYFHACFEILGRIMKLPISKIQLGCVQTDEWKEIVFIENNMSPFVKNTAPNVVMV